MKTASEIADEIGMEWQRVPMLASLSAHEKAWRNILRRMRERHGREKVTAALKLIEGGMFNGCVPHEDI